MTCSQQASELFRLLFLSAVLAISCGCHCTSCSQLAWWKGTGECQPEAGCPQGSTCGGFSFFCTPVLFPVHHEQKYSRFCDETTAKCRAGWAASSALKEMGCHVSCDYRQGFEQAFRDVALGSDGRIPAFPPAPYWKDGARSPEGHAKAQEWFAGYAAGAEIAVARRGMSNYVYTAGAPDCQSGVPCEDRWTGVPAGLQ